AVLHDKAADYVTACSVKIASVSMLHGGYIWLYAPRSISVEHEGHVNVFSEGPGDRVPLLLAPKQRFPRIKVLRLVEVAVRDVGVVFQAGDRKQVVSICGLPDVH